MRSAPFWVVSSVATHKSSDLVCVTVSGLCVMVLRFVQLWVLCSSFVDISPFDVILDISIIDVEYFHKTVRMAYR